MNKYLLSFLLFFVISGVALAHQPRLVGDDLVIKVEDPEISKAYYGTLKGEPAIYIIQSNEPFNFYLDLLVPDVEGVNKNVFLEVVGSNGWAWTSFASSLTWEKFHEPFTGDDYWVHKQLDRDAEAGTYTITVYSSNNEDKYALAIGKTESFPLNEIWHTIKVLPELKTDFFEKSILTSYMNVIGLFMLAAIGFVALIIYGVKKLFF